LIGLLRSPDTDGDELARAAIEAGPVAVPPLRSLLGNANTEEEQLGIFVALAFIGGSDALSIIKKAYDENRELAPALAMVLPSVDSKENRRLLLHLLDGDPDGEHGAIGLAAFSLGLLRAKEARKPLREIVKKWPGEPPAEAAVVALDWIQRVRRKSSQSLSQSGNASLLRYFKMVCPRDKIASMPLMKKPMAIGGMAPRAGRLHAVIRTLQPQVGPRLRCSSVRTA
jgi:hypothetical protein